MTIPKSILTEEEKEYASHIAELFQKRQVDPKLGVEMLRRIAQDIEQVHEAWLKEVSG